MRNNRQKTRTLSHADSPKHLKGKIVVIDTETTGLEMFHGDRIFCMAYLTDKGEYGYVRRGEASVKWFRKLFRDKRKTVVFHNAKFDLKMFAVEGIDILNIKARVDCTLTMSKVLDSTSKSHDLEYLADKKLGMETQDKNEIKDWLKLRNTKAKVKERGRKLGFHDVPDEIVKRRIIWDVRATLGLYMMYNQRVKSECYDLYETERKLIMVCVDMEMYGVPVDITKARQLKAEAEASLTEIQEEINRLSLPIKVTKKIKKVPTEVVISDSVSIASGPQMEGVFKSVGIKLQFKTKSKKCKKTGVMKGGGSWSFDEYSMVRYVSRPLAECIREASEEGWGADKFISRVHKVVKHHGLNSRELIPPLVLRHRQLKKMVSTYYNAIITKAVSVTFDSKGRETGILHCQFNPSEAKTGRFSSSKPNLQNIPRILGPRECFITRRGRRHWHLDYSQVEMRFFCHFAEDEGMAAAIDDDVHEYVATKIYRKSREEITKEQRKRAKGTNFGILYGSGAETQAETMTKKGLPTTTYEAKVIVAAYHREFPKVRKLTNKLKSEIARNGFITNPFGRRYKIPLKMAYIAINYMCQGTSADLIKKAMVDIWEWMRVKKFKSRLILTIHDEIIFETTRREEREIVTYALQKMARLTEFFVPIVADAEVVTGRWSKKKCPVKDMKMKWVKDIIDGQSLSS